jgi:hypothetical protein
MEFNPPVCARQIDDENINIHKTNHEISIETRASVVSIPNEISIDSSKSINTSEQQFVSKSSKALELEISEKIGLDKYYKDKALFKLYFIKEANRLLLKFDKKFTRYCFFLRNYGAVLVYRCSKYHKMKCPCEINLKYYLSCDIIKMNIIKDCEHLYI